MGSLRRSSFRSQPARPARQWDGDALPTPRLAPVRVACNESALVAPIPKAEPLRSEGYRRFVASFPCFGCGIAGYSQCAHPNVGKGLGLKTDDRNAFPLCSVRPGHIGCHQQHDLLIDMTLGQRREMERQYTVRMQDIARRAGRKEFA